MTTYGRSKWTFEICHASAMKYTSRAEWRRCEPAARNAAYKNGWGAKCTAHMPHDWSVRSTRHPKRPLVLAGLDGLLDKEFDDDY